MKHKLEDADQIKWETIVLAKTKINVSGKVMDATIERSDRGHISINIDHKYFQEGEWLKDGTTTEGYDVGRGIEIELCKFQNLDVEYKVNLL